VSNRELEQTFCDVIQQIRSKLPQASSIFAEELIQAHEWGIALEMIYDWIDEDEIAITFDVFSSIQSLALAITINSRDWSSLEEYVIL
jgi:hypothetical protein